MQLLIAGTVLVLDQLSKALLYDQSVLNVGIAFGIGRSTRWLLPLFLLIGIGCLVGLYRGSRHPVGSPAYWAWPCIVGGLTSNIIDRIRLGAVIDPLAVPLLALQFNLADVAIVTGCVLLGYTVLRGRRV